MSRRTERVEEQLRAELARLLRAEVADPRIDLVTITRVDVSPDLRNARVYWSRLGTEAEAESEAAADACGDGLASAAAFLRRRLAQLLPLKRVPALDFHYDPSVALGSRTLELLRELREDREGEG